MSNVIRMPKPSVTALVPSGSINPVSSSQAARPPYAIAAAASPPRTTASTVAIAANRNELASAVSGSTPTRTPGRSSPESRWRHAVSV